MEKRFLGKGHLEVSAIGLGCIGFTQSFPPYPDKDTCMEVIRKAADVGVTFFDTAQVYTMGTNEELVGEALQPYRDNVVIASRPAVGTIFVCAIRLKMLAMLINIK